MTPYPCGKLSLVNQWNWNSYCYPVKLLNINIDLNKIFKHIIYKFYISFMHLRKTLSHPNFPCRSDLGIHRVVSYLLMVRSRLILSLEYQELALAACHKLHARNMMPTWLTRYDNSNNSNKSKVPAHLFRLLGYVVTIDVRRDTKLGCLHAFSCFGGEVSNVKVYKFCQLKCY